MKLMDKLKETFAPREGDEYEEEYENEEMSVNTAAPVPPKMAAGTSLNRAVPTRQAKPYTMVVVNPKDYSDAEKIGDHLKSFRPVVMNMEKTDMEEAQRIVDVVQGVMYALDGRIDQISENIYLCAPNNMSVSRENFAAFPESVAAQPAWAPHKAPQE